MSLATAASVGLGLPNMPVARVIGHPGVQSREQLRTNVLDTTLQQVIDNLLKAPNAAKGDSDPGPRDVVVKGGFDEINDYFYRHELSDGLPIVPPTREKVEQFLKFTDRDPDESLGSLLPDSRAATIWSIAVNGVMAGCRPEYMPVLIAALQAAADPEFGLYSVQATTHPCAVLMLISGPIVQELGLNFAHGSFGPGFRPNASLGRAMRLVLMNVGGGIPGHGDQSTHGSPAKFSYCVAENEAATPWEPFRVTRGFGKNDSTVTVFSGEGPHNVNDHVCTSAETTLTVVANTMTTIGHNNAGSVIRGDVLVAFGPEHAHTVASGGLSKGDVQKFLYERARNKVGLLKLRAMYKAENWPDWVDQADDEALCPIVGKPEDIHIVVTGGPGKHSAFIPTFGTSKSVTRKIEPRLAPPRHDAGSRPR